MILDVINNLKFYESVNKKFTEIVSLIETADFSRLEPGRHEAGIEGVYFLVNTYETINESRDILEAHRKYIDVQYMITGEEIIDYEPLESQIINKEYDADADYILYKPENSIKVTLKTGMVAIFLPNDLHMPGYAFNQPTMINKIVFKVLID